MAQLANDIAAIRSFNRFYTRIIGLLNEGMMQSPFSLPEARIIHEIGKSGTTTAKELVTKLDMDTGQLSRIVSGLAGQGLLAITPNTEDRRSNNISLAKEGDRACAGLNEMSDAAAAELIAPFDKSERQRLVQSMQTIQNILGGEPSDRHLIFRSHKVGELGWLIYRQAALYNLEYGWNSEFETLIAKIYADFEAAPETPPKALWIAECDGEIAGSIFVIPAEENRNVAQLRMLYVEPWARGQGIGHKLVEQAVHFARDKGYDSLMLWTQDCLTAARKIYQSAGFQLVREARHHSFGHDLNGQYWQIDFKSGQ
jgi:DNA-binding MarR family transcriptional regulator/GNAT superfamily N-acetyltransferase